jgi:ribosomal protein S18 acetylase RimI-like enzyme
MNILPLKTTDIPALAAFISRLQQNPTHHIGYLSENTDDIQISLHDIENLERQFFLARNETNITGFIGMDFDDTRAWIYGPMCDTSDWESTVDGLWQQLEPLLAQSKTWLLFCDLQNTRVANFAQKIGCLEHGVECVFLFKREQLQPLHKPNTIGHIITPNDHAAFTALHDAIFPGTYFSGTEILERLSSQRALFVTDGVTGYSYAEVSDSGEASLEFIGITPEARGQGIGQALMMKTLEWIFSFEETMQVLLTVNAQNTQALRMYAKLGFLEQRRMVSYRKISSHKNLEPSTF